MQKLINNVEHCVDDSIRGVLALNSNIRLIEGSRVVVRSDCAKPSKKVAVICGGGSGHEPAYAGYVGKGFLSAAICGDIFTSPNPSQTITALNTYRHSAGILVFVFNYTGDRLNSAIAIERFKSQKNACPVRTVLVADDCAFTDLKDRSAGRRGLAGGLMVLKMVCAAAENGLGLDALAEIAERMVIMTRTIGISLSSCCLPGRGPIFELPVDEMELGLGVHGEPGVTRMKTAGVAVVVDKMLTQMTDPSSATSFSLDRDDVAVLINNLGGISQLEMNIVAKETLEWLGSRHVNVLRCVTGTLMTSLEMRGISISVVKLSDRNWIEWLDNEVESLSWPAPALWRYGNSSYAKSVVSPLITEDNIDASAKVAQHMATISSDVTSILGSAIRAACLALIKNQDGLDNLDAQCGDGDCGATMKRGAEAILNGLASFDISHPHILLQQIASTWEAKTGGTSGALYSLFMLAASNCMVETADSYAWLTALVVGVEAIMKHGGAKPGDRTMIDPLNAAADVAKAVLAARRTVDRGVLQELKEAIKAGAEATINMKARAGRASYVAAAHLHSPDPGAMATYYWMTAAFSELERLFDN